MRLEINRKIMSKNNLLVFIVFLVFYSAPAHAYLDPGTGNVLISLLIAGFAAFFFYIKGLVYKVSKKEQTEQTDPISSDTAETKIAIF